MSIQLLVDVLGDGRIGLEWSCAAPASSFHVLVIRTGARPAHTSIALSGKLGGYALSNLSRHQRYRVAVVATTAAGVECSPWFSVTPRAGLPAQRELRPGAMEDQLARVEQLLLMPQDRRITAFWTLTPGFVDRVVLELLEEGGVRRTLELEPEVRSCALTADRGFELRNGKAYAVRLATRFVSAGCAHPLQAGCTPAPRGAEREANRGHERAHLIFASLEPSPEIAIFPEDQGGAPRATTGAPAQIICCHCRRRVEWAGDQLVCSGCKAEFVPNDAGAFLDSRSLRFGTCRCCQPRKILIQPPGSESLVCNHSGKEYIRMPGARAYLLLEDLPFGLCQCCRPRQPLAKGEGGVRCMKTGELHVSADGRYVLAPSQPVFDAAAIDALLDAGLAEISQTGVSRSRH